MHRDLVALDAHPLLPRLLHTVEHPDATCRVLDRELPAPLVPRAEPWRDAPPPWPLVRLEASDWLARADGTGEWAVVARLPTGRMADLVSQARRLGDRAPAGVILDLSPLADATPFGETVWRPRGREELAELRAAAGRPLWVDGITSPADAEAAAEAGVDGVVIRSEAGRNLDGPAVAEVLPEVLDTVAGMVGVYVGGPVRSGIDVFRYLALGAEGVLPDASTDVSRLAAELDYAMRMTGCATLEEIGYEALFAPLWEESS
ncbi:MAG: alpha-hydroxy-acid oxidizing protein [Trueperaceae bacterium]|nr:alpha-hydroxy-acid oxidizing protein [Trueperaceae bacterium]